MHQFKPLLLRLLRPVAERVAAYGGTANQVTMAALLGSVVVGLALTLVGPHWSPVWLLLPSWMLTRMLLNALDGLLAREHGQASRLGAYLNELVDVVCDAVLILPLAGLPGVSAVWVVSVVLLASWTELAGVLGVLVGASRRHDGPMGKADRALWFGLLGGWLAWAGAPPPGLVWGQGAMVGALLVTVARRVSYGLSDGAEGSA